MTPLFKGLSGKRGFVGVAIFSRFPIINQGDIVFGENTLNKGVYVDVAVNRDTIRVFNVHLHSMSIKADSLFATSGYQEIKENYLDTFRRLRTGFAARGQQIAILEEYIRSSPYKVVVCGDFNDIPYSYTYQKLRSNLKNAFEEAGRGFGFTYNGKLFFLRIDNQFFDPRLSALAFSTLRDIPYSDHFPIFATYRTAPADD
jgi:endonuclease/exonuclease/phosphatase (EEP) superfamily protein YafD